MNSPVVQYGSLSYWHETAPSRPASRPVEPGRRFDIAIIGAGFTGLWTALHLLEQDPGLAIALFEQAEVGYGASGRNGGFAMTHIGFSLHQMLRDHGREATLAVQTAAEAAVEGIVNTVAREEIDCELRYSGLLTVATNEAQERKVRRDITAASKLGLDSVWPVEGAELQGSIHSPTYRMAMAERCCAVLHPAKLARGLADLAVHKGVTLYERSGPVDIKDEQTRVRIDTEHGPVYAETVVVATNAWTAANAAFRRALIPMYTYIIATEPLTGEMWDSIGWSTWEGIEDKRVHLHYYRRTADGRLLMGGRDNITTFRSRIGPKFDRNERIFHLLQQSVRRTFPQLRDVRFTHGWGGPIAITPDFLPKFGSLGDRIHFGWGYCGHGVGPSYLGGQILRDLATGKESELTNLVFVNRPLLRYPSEPLRSFGAYLTRRESLWYDEGAEAGKDVKREPILLRVATRLFGQ